MAREPGAGDSARGTARLPPRTQAGVGAVARARDSRAAFTLLEVLLATLVLGLLLTTLLSFSSQHAFRLGLVRSRAEAARAAEAHARALETEIGLGVLPEVGTSEGSFDDPSLRWELTVEPYAIPLPEEQAEDRALSSIFSEPSTRRLGPQPSVRRLVLRVFREVAGEPEEAAEPFVLFAVEPLSADELEDAIAVEELLEEDLEDLDSP